MFCRTPKNSGQTFIRRVEFDLRVQTTDVALQPAVWYDIPYLLPCLCACWLKNSLYDFLAFLLRPRFKVDKMSQEIL